jgi:hypothetical protein
MFKIIGTGLVVSIYAQQVEASPLKCHEKLSEESYIQCGYLSMSLDSFLNGFQYPRKKDFLSRIFP